MGAFYVNYTVKGANQKAIVQALSGRKALVSPERNGCVVVFDEKSDSQDQEAIALVAAQISVSLQTTVLTVLNHDSDILWYQLYEAGTLTDQYNSTPNYWSPNSESSAPKGGNAKQLCSAFKCGDVFGVDEILRASLEEYPDATDRHADLCRALELPSFTVGYGFGTIAQGYLPEGVSASEFAAVN